jgi:hypothetical protein
MVEFTTIILKFGDQGEKTGWRYISKKSFRVRGMLDALGVTGMALMPMGDGDFIMALKADVRKAIHKNEGAMVKVVIEEDVDYKVGVPDDLQECLDEDPEALTFFMSLAQSHRDYFVKWIEGAKTQPTRVKRVVNTVNAMARRMDYGQMIRSLNKKNM